MFSSLQFHSNVNKYFHLNKITNVLFFSFSILIVFLLFSFDSQLAQSEEIITIVPGSSDSSRYRFFDITEYPINPGKEIKWYNADNILHNIKVMY